MNTCTSIRKIYVDICAHVYTYTYIHTKRAVSVHTDMYIYGHLSPRDRPSPESLQPVGKISGFGASKIRHFLYLQKNSGNYKNTKNTTTPNKQNHKHQKQQHFRIYIYIA